MTTAELNAIDLATEIQRDAETYRAARRAAADAHPVPSEPFDINRILDEPAEIKAARAEHLRAALGAGYARCKAASDYLDQCNWG